MVEALACGTPLIAFGRGGSRDIVTEETGVLFPTQSTEAVIAAVKAFEARGFAPEACRARAELFSEARFRVGLRAAVERHR